MAVPLFVLENERRKVYKTRKLFEHLSDSEIQTHTGLPAWGAREIIELFSPLEGFYSSAIPLETKVLCYLSHLRSGSFQWTLGSLGGVSQPSISRIINQCLDLTLEWAPRVIHFPKSVHERNQVKQSFNNSYGFPNVIGVIDGTHVPIKAPAENENIYVCRKQYHSINTQVITGPDLSIFDVVAKWPGSTHDSFVYRNSAVRDRLYQNQLGEGWLLGDSGYPLEERLLTPFNIETEESHKIFNEKQRKARNSVERGIGVWKARYRTIDKTGGTICYSEKKACKIIIATATLHNICIRKEIPQTAEDAHFQETRPRSSDPEDIPQGETRRASAVLLRQRLANSFA